jgi:hypothetical protein
MVCGLPSDCSAARCCRTRQIIRYSSYASTLRYAAAVEKDRTIAAAGSVTTNLDLLQRPIDLGDEWLANARILHLQGEVLRLEQHLFCLGLLFGKQSLLADS